MLARLNTIQIIGGTGTEHGDVRARFGFRPTRLYLSGFAGRDS